MKQQIKEYKSYLELYKEYNDKAYEITDTAFEFKTKANEILCSLFEEFILNKVFKKKQGIITIYGVLRDRIRLSFENIIFPETLHELLENHNITFDKFQEGYSLSIRQTEIVNKKYNMYDIGIVQFPFNFKENTIFDLIDKYDIKISVNEINFKISYLEEVIKKLKSYGNKTIE